MTNLKKTQQQFLNYLYNTQDNLILKNLKTGKTNKEILFSIYRNNKISNLTQSLEITFPKLLKFLGNKKFSSLAQDFIKTYPSKTNSLNDSGQFLSKYLANKNQLFLADIAKVEWLLHQSYLAENDFVLDTDELNNIIQKYAGNIVFKLHPHCFLMQSFFNLHAKYKLSKPNQRCNFYLIIRQNLHASFIKIPKTEFNFLSAISKGNSLIEMHNKKIFNIDKYLAKHLNKTLVPCLISLEDKV